MCVMLALPDRVAMDLDMIMHPERANLEQFDVLAFIITSLSPLCMVIFEVQF